MDLFVVLGLNMEGFAESLFLILSFWISKLIFGIIGISYSFKIINIPYEKRLKQKRTSEYIVVILSVISLGFSYLSSILTARIFNYTNIEFLIITKLFLIITYLMINKRHEKAKGIVFLILSIFLLLL